MSNRPLKMRKEELEYIPGPGYEYEIPVFYYCPEEGYFVDELQIPVPNIYDYITPDIFQHFLHFKETDIYEVFPCGFVELYFPAWFDGTEEDLK